MENLKAGDTVYAVHKSRKEEGQMTVDSVGRKWVRFCSSTQALRKGGTSNDYFNFYPSKEVYDKVKEERVQWGNLLRELGITPSSPLYRLDTPELQKVYDILHD